MQLIKVKFFKTIKFKLAIMFTVILFVFAGTIILLFNMAIDNYLSTRPLKQEPAIVQQLDPPRETEEQKIRAIYSNNLEYIQSVSIISLIPLAIISFLIGYLLAGRFLKPLNELNKQIDKLKFDNLGAQICNVQENEMGKTISSFNEMSIRLQRAFDQQARFVQDASHELRTPLTIVRINMETVLDDSSATKQELKNSMRDSLNSLDSVTELANDLLTLSRPQSKKRTKENLEDIVRECTDSMKDLLKKNNVLLKLKTERGQINVSVNKSEIIRAFKNIIDNAIKYSKTNNSPEVLVKIFKNEDSGMVEIQDNGIGIPKADVSKIFDRFYRVDKSRDRETGGFGLGLAITKKIILEHNGKISIQSKPKSTIFIVKIPVVKIF